MTAAEKALASVEVDKLTLEAERLKRVVADQEKSIGEEEKKAERDKTIGNTIYSHLNELQTFTEYAAESEQRRKRLEHRH